MSTSTLCHIYIKYFIYIWQSVLVLIQHYVIEVSQVGGYLCTTVSSINKTDRQAITKILLRVLLLIITLYIYYLVFCIEMVIYIGQNQPCHYFWNISLAIVTFKWTRSQPLYTWDGLAFDQYFDDIFFYRISNLIF